MKYTPGCSLILGGLAMWVLGICAVWLGYIEGAAVATILGLLFVVGGIALDWKLKEYGLINDEKKEPTKPTITDPKADGFAIGVAVARKIIELERLRAEISAKTRVEFISPPNGGEVSIQLRPHNGKRWVVSVPISPGNWDHYYFDDYGEALKFYEAVKAGMEAYFWGGGNGSGEDTA